MGHQRLFLLAYAVFCLLSVFGDSAPAFVLLGPNRAENGSHGASSPGSGFFQEFDAGFRWSTSSLTYAIDSSFTTAFGTAGADAVRNSFATWDAAFGVTDAPTSTGSIFDPGDDVFDIESISLHEIGHALGFHHPNQADDSDLNFNPSGTPIAATGNEVMHSTITVNEIQRELTQDDIDGMNHAYSTTNAVPRLNATSTGTEDSFGPGDLDFTESGTATAGGLAGANFDIFAEDLGSGGTLGVTRIFGGSRTGGGLSFGGTPLGGFFDGVPNDLHGSSLDNANHGNTLTSIDIVFNTNSAAMLGVNPNPEPGTLIFCSVAALGLLARFWRQRQRLRKEAEQAFASLPA